MKKNIYDVAVLGGGAAGMMAAIQAATLGVSVIILEGNECLGKKILATGNGRCNLTNENITEGCYYGGDRGFLQHVFQGFSQRDTLDFFHEIGLAPTNRDGLYYPRCQQAGAVVAQLHDRLSRLSVQILYEARVRGICKEDDGVFLLTHTKGELRCRKVILATGGKASAIKGSNGDGYYYAQNLGHTITPMVPSLVQLHTDFPGISSMAGARCECRLTLCIQGQCVGQESGELQLTDYGISGIVVFQLSRLAAYGLQEGKQVEMLADFMPEFSRRELVEILETRIGNAWEKCTVKDVLWGLINDKVILGILKHCNIPPEQSVLKCERNEINRLADSLKGFPFHITDTHGFKHAQVTAGGISTEDICPDTMESKLCPGFYMAGEIVDVDGICGGYNLQWAWSSGAVAGRSAAKEVL